MLPQLTNPAHDLSKIVDNIKTAPGVIYFFDLLLRLTTTFFIFQIVSAFRKYVK